MVSIMQLHTKNVANSERQLKQFTLYKEYAEEFGICQHKNKKGLNRGKW